jgi:hypothetical protein
MDRTTDLEKALSFVVRRIEEQAKTSGHPLNEEEQSLLKNLPSSNVSYLIHAGDLGPPALVPRNINLERLCALAKAAYLNDREMNPESLDWEFAFAVFRLNRHPMWGLPQQAGVKYRRPPGDGILLLIASLLFVVAAVMLAFLVGIGDEPWTRLQWIEFGLGYSAVVVLMYFGSRRRSPHLFRATLPTKSPLLNYTISRIEFRILLAYPSFIFCTVPDNHLGTLSLGGFGEHGRKIGLLLLSVCLLSAAPIFADSTTFTFTAIPGNLSPMATFMSGGLSLSTATDYHSWIRSAT